MQAENADVSFPMMLSVFFRSCVPCLVVMAMLLCGAVAKGASATAPVGYLAVEAAAGAGAVHTITPLSMPLLPPPDGVANQVAGRVTGVRGNVLSSASAGWVPGLLAGKDEPLFLWLKSGQAAGHAFRITANTSDALTLDTRGLSLAALGVGAGDVWRISRGWTLRGLFGSPQNGVVGGSSADLFFDRTDKVLVNDAGGAVLTCYFDEPSGKWKRAGSTASQDNLAISPIAGVFYHRIASTPLAITRAGEVATLPLKRVINLSGSTLVSPGYPADTTVADLGLQYLAGWRKAGDPGVTSINSDRMVIKDVTSNKQVSLYYDWDNQAWRDGETQGNWDSHVLTAGMAVMLVRSGRGSPQVWRQEMPVLIPQP